MAHAAMLVLGSQWHWRAIFKNSLLCKWAHCPSEQPLGWHFTLGNDKIKSFSSVWPSEDPESGCWTLLRSRALTPQPLTSCTALGFPDSLPQGGIGSKGEVLHVKWLCGSFTELCLIAYCN